MDVLQSLNYEYSKGISHFLTLMKSKIEAYTTRASITDPSRGMNRQLPFKPHTIVLKLKEKLNVHIKFLNHIIADEKYDKICESDLEELLNVSIQLTTLARQYDDHDNIYKSKHIDVKACLESNFKMLVDMLNIEEVRDKADTGINTPANNLDLNDTNATKIVDCTINTSNCGTDYPLDCLIDESGFISSEYLNNDPLFASDCKPIDSNNIQESSDVPNNSDDYIFEGLIPQISDQIENDDLFIISPDYSKASSNGSLDIPLNFSCNVVLENDSACIIDSAHQIINKEMDSNNFDFPLIDNESLNAEIIFIKDRTNYLLFCFFFEADGKSAITDFHLLANGIFCQHVLKFSKMCFTANSLLSIGLENIQHYINQRIQNIRHIDYQEMNNDIYLFLLHYTSK